MASKKGFLLRMDPALYEDLEAWAAADYRSVNAQIEYLLTRLVERRRRARKGAVALVEGEGVADPDWEGTAELDLSVD